MSSPLRLLAPLLALAACDSYTVGDPPEQLEALDAQLSPDVQPAAREGELLVVGGPQDFAFVLTEDDGKELAFEVHSPGSFDLLHLDGPERTLHLLGGSVSGHQSLVVEEETGPIWAADLGDRAAAVALLLGGDAVRHGDTIFVDQDDTWKWTYTTLIVPTDDGDVELLPGDVETVTIGGVYWRVVAVAAYTRRLRSGAEVSDCERMQDMLAYEMFRVAVPERSSARTRPAGLASATLGCEP